MLVGTSNLAASLSISVIAALSAISAVAYNTSVPWLEAAVQQPDLCSTNTYQCNQNRQQEPAAST